MEAHSSFHVPMASAFTLERSKYIREIIKIEKMNRER